MNSPGTPRRQFLRNASAAAAAITTVPGQIFGAETTPQPTSETLVQQLFGTLNETQRSQLVFPFDHQLRSAIDNNWHIVKPRVRDLTPDQKALTRDIFRHLHAEEYQDAVLAQVEEDNRGGFESGSIAIFGEPGTGKFEFVYTGRHVTRRCDGDSVDGTAFGGPIFYGHQSGPDFDEAPDHPGNVYWFQAQRANEVYEMLDGTQRETALRSQPRRERKNETVELKGSDGEFEGLAVSEMTADQKTHMQLVLQDLLAPFRPEDAAESMRLIEAGGVDNLRLAFYKNHDVGDDGVWDTWQLEGPDMVWHFRGDPHVHTWVNIRQPA